MKQLQASAYLASVKDDLKEIIDRLSQDFSFVSILGSDVSGRSYRVTSNEVHLGASPDQERGFVLRMQGPQGFSELSFNHVDVDRVVEEAMAVGKTDRARFLKNTEALPYRQVAEDPEWKASFVNEVENLPEDDDPKEILATMRASVKACQEKYPAINFIQSALIITQIDKIFLSKNRDLSQTYAYANLYGLSMASNEKGGKDDFSDASGLMGSEILVQLDELLERSAKNTLELLEAEPMTPGEYDIITDPAFTGLIAHEAFGHGAEMDMYVKGRAKGQEYTDKRVGSPLLNMRDGAHAGQEVASFFFDDEGQPAGDTHIIEAGILRSGMCDELSAYQLGFHPTGNGRRESYKRKAYTRMTNTFFQPGEAKLEEMMASIDHGYYLEGFFSGMEDPKNWGIQCVAAKAREIKDGQFTGKLFSPVYLTGYVPDLLGAISMVSDAEGLKLGGCGYCGKGWKEWVKVSQGGSYLKTRGRLN